MSNRFFIRGFSAHSRRATWLGCVLVVSTASASVVTFETPLGSTTGGKPVNAQAAFTTTTSTVTIALRNLVVDPTSVVQNLSGLMFTLDSGQTTGTLASSLGLERTVNSDRTFVDGAVVPVGWTLFNAPLNLNLLGTPTAPVHTLIGPAGANSLYNNANGSIRGNGPHNAFLTGDVTFVLGVPGVTAESRVNAATFQFNTSAGNEVEGRPVPEPGTFALLLLGALAVARRRSGVWPYFLANPETA